MGFYAVNWMNSFRLRSIDPNPQSNDCLLLWQWRNDPYTRSISHSSKPIAWEQHCHWYQQVASDPSRLLKIAQAEAENQTWIDVGSLRLDIQSDNQSAIISLQIDPNYRSRGFGKQVLRLGCELAFEELNLQQIEASIHSSNQPSIRLFTSFGFQKAQDGRFKSYYLRRLEYR